MPSTILCLPPRRILTFESINQNFSHAIGPIEVGDLQRSYDCANSCAVSGNHCANNSSDPLSIPREIIAMKRLVRRPVKRN